MWNTSKWPFLVTCIIRLVDVFYIFTHSAIDKWSEHIKNISMFPIQFTNKWMNIPVLHDLFMGEEGIINTTLDHRSKGGGLNFRHILLPSGKGKPRPFWTNISYIILFVSVFKKWWLNVKTRGRVYTTKFQMHLLWLRHLSLYIDELLIHSCWKGNDEKKLIYIFFVILWIWYY